MLGASLALIGLGVVPVGAEPAARGEANLQRPNILMIYMDDHAAQTIGAYGSAFGPTPNIDAIAAAGMRFDRAFCSNSICGPARAVTLTGQHSHINGVRDNRGTFDGSQATFPKALAKAGYETALFGKWHLKSTPTGFAHFEVLRGQGPYYNPLLLNENGQKKHRGYTTRIVTDRALEWLEKERNPKKPFLLMLQHKAPHRNWQPGPEELRLFDNIAFPYPATLFDDWATRNRGCRDQEMSIAHHLRDNYDLKLAPPRGLDPEQLKAWNAAYEPRNQIFRANPPTGEARTRWNFQRYAKDYMRCIMGVDAQVGRVLAALDEAQLSQNTILIYTSDQGFYVGEHGWYDKRWMYEESLKVPLLVRWPGVVTAGSSDDHLVQNLDFAATFCELAGVPDGMQTQGQSFVPLLRNIEPSEERDAIYYRYFEKGEHNVPPHHGIRTRSHKLIRYPDEDFTELFDLESDPSELRNLAADEEHQTLRRDLESRLKALAAKFGDQLP